MRYWLVMPAAGSGSRFGAPTPKQYAPLAGRTVIEWALAPFLEDARCLQLVVALAPGDTQFRALAAATRARVQTVVGGAQRSLSVRAGLASLAERAADADWVLVHDAARPCLGSAERDRLLGELATHPLGGLLALRSTDTLKRATAAHSHTVAETVDRSELWRALTPQMFRYGALCAALDQAHAAARYPSDEAQALEWAGGQPALVEGTTGNLKITTAADLVMAAAQLALLPGAPKAQRA
jgi:2-C-methyl-D-erythritol 4-phosphate cytidylyltransferase